MKTLEDTNPSARGAHIYKGPAESRSGLGRSIITMVQHAESLLWKGPDPKLRNESCRQVSPSQVRDACGPHDGNEHTRRAIASDGVHSAQQCGPAGLVCSFPPTAPPCHSAMDSGMTFAWESCWWLSPLRAPRTQTSDRDQRSGICERLEMETPPATAG